MGAFDTTTTVTDGVTDNLAQYHNELKTAIDHVMSAAAYAAYCTPASMTGNVTLTDASLPILSYAPTAARDLTLPVVATTNHAFYVINRSGTYAITVKDAAAATITTVAINATTFLVSDGANSWYPMGGGALTKAAASDVTTGTDDAKYVTALAIKNSVNVPNVAPVTDGHVMTVASGAWTSAAASAAQYPKTFFAFASQFNSSTAITEGVGNATTSLYQYLANQTTPADGNYLEVGLVLAAGTYTCTVLGYQGTDAGKLDWKLGATSQTTGQDWYGVNTYNIFKSFTLTVPTSGYFVLRATVNGKNASSSNYYWNITAVNIKPATY